MADTLEVTTGSLGPSLRAALEAYYRLLPQGSEYLQERWSAWRQDPHVQVLAAVGAQGEAGWLVFDAQHSMVEELVLRADCDATGVGRALLDALVAREVLVAARVLESDRAKAALLIDYGFRPVRRERKGQVLLQIMELSMPVALEVCQRAGRPSRWPGREKVVVERVPAGGDDAGLAAGLRRLLAPLGGLEAFVRPGQSVVIKPNIVSDHGLKDGEYRGGVVTDPRLLRELVRMLLPLAGTVTIAEGSSINRSATGKMFAHYGLDRLQDLAPGRVRLVDLNQDRVVEKPVPGGKRMRVRRIPVTLEEADVIISVPVMKIHFAAIVSLAIKNLQGAVPPLEKYMTHFYGLAQNLVNIHHLVRPSLTIVDGLVGQEDFGPISGVPKPMNLLIAGTNPVAVDAVTMRIMGLEPASAPAVRLAALQGMGPLELDAIDIVGPPLEEVSERFRQPLISLQGGTCLTVHDGGACPGCRGYLHFALSKLRRPDPDNPGQNLVDRRLPRHAHIHLGPHADGEPDPKGTHLFMGICRQHQAHLGTHLPGCPPHAEVILNGVFGLFPGVERPSYADKSEEATLGEMLEAILARERVQE